MKWTTTVSSFNVNEKRDLFLTAFRVTSSEQSGCFFRVRSSEQSDCFILSLLTQIKISHSLFQTNFSSIFKEELWLIGWKEITRIVSKCWSIAWWPLQKNMWSRRNFLSCASKLLNQNCWIRIVGSKLLDQNYWIKIVGSELLDQNCCFCDLSCLGRRFGRKLSLLGICSILIPS